MRETMASLKKELEEALAARLREAKLVRWHEGQLNEIGQALEMPAPAPAPMDGMGYHSDREKKPEYSASQVMGLATKMSERINGLEHHLRREKEITEDILDRFVPHKPKSIRTTHEDDPNVDPFMRRFQ